MNVVLLFVALFLIGAIGGVVHGLIVYEGLIKPQPVTRDVPVGPLGAQRTIQVTMWALGAIGHAVIGGVAGVLVFCVYMRPTFVIGGSAPLALTLYDVGTVLVAGLGGSTAINELVEKRQWTKLAPVLQASEPELLDQLQITRSSRPIQVLRALR